MKTIYFNEDNAHFYSFHPASEMTEEGVRSLVDRYAQTGSIRGLLFCTNLQRALFDSNVWERFRDVNPGRPDPYSEHLRLLSERGIDHFAIWLKRAAELGIEGWLTMRMNDAHGYKEADLGQTSCIQSFWVTEYWKKHPHLRRAPYRYERDWEGAYNYFLPEVRTYHLALVRELFDRYDMFGFECDWMRWGMMFAPGFEREGQNLLTEFVSEIRSIADAAEQKRGHRILLAHRIPAHPESALNYGFDLMEWGKRGCVDMVTLSSFLGSSNYDPQIRLWKAMLPKECTVNVHVEQHACSSPGNMVQADDILRGAAAAAWASGADFLYLFNECYREPEHLDDLNKVMTEISDPEKLIRSPRRTAVTYPQAIIAGESMRTVLPVPLIPEHVGHDLGRMEENITLRLPAGKLLPSANVLLSLAFSFDTEFEKLGELPVRVNTVPVRFAGSKQIEKTRVEPDMMFQPFPDYPRDAGFVLSFHVPAEILHETFNAVEILPPHARGRIVWADFLIQ